MDRRGGVVTVRIAHVITKGDMGGAQTHVVELATAQQLVGHAVTVIAGTDGPAIRQCAQAGVECVVVHSLGASRSAGLSRAAFADLRAALARVDPDVVHAHSSHAGLVARIVARRLGKPSVYTAHGWPFQRGAPWRQRTVSLVGEAIGGRVGDAVICLTDAERQLARRCRIASANRLWVVPNGLADRDDHHQRPVSARPALIMVARFAPPKQQQQVVTALAGLLHLDWRITFVGDGPGLAACAERADRVLGARASFLGARDDVAELLTQHDVMVLWSDYEGLPMSLLEGMRAGLCCVASDLPGVRELFGEPPVGRTAGSPDELAREIERLLSDTELRKALGRQARLRFESEYLASVMQARVARVYETVLAPKAVRRGRR